MRVRWLQCKHHAEAAWSSRDIYATDKKRTGFNLSDVKIIFILYVNQNAKLNNVAFQPDPAIQDDLQVTDSEEEPEDGLWF